MIKKQKRIFLFMFFSGIFFALICIACFLLKQKREQQQNFISNSQFLAKFKPSSLSEKTIIELKQIPPESMSSLSSKDEEFGLFYKKDGFEKQVVYDGQKLEALEVSPSKDRLVFTLVTNDDLEDNLIMIYDIHHQTAREVFATNATGLASYPQWLGDENLFFLEHCGTACQGITILNIQSKKTMSGVLSFDISEYHNHEFWKTTFTDWFNCDHQLSGFPDNIRSETINGKLYLVFSMIDEEGQLLGEKRFLFTGHSLISV